MRNQSVVTKSKFVTTTSKVPKSSENSEVATQDKDEKLQSVDIDLLKEIKQLRTDIDESFVKLDRMLYMAKSKEQVSDFPVAFVTNLLYLISLNDL